METTNLSQYLTLLARTSVEAGILVVLVLGAQWVFRRQLSARWRCSLWLVVMGRLLLPCSFSSGISVFNLLPHWTQPEAAIPAANAPGVQPSAGQPAPVIASAGIAEKTAAAMPERLSVSAPEIMPVPIDAPPGGWSWPVWIFAVWLAGVLVLAGQVAVSSLRLWRRCAELSPLTQPVTATVLEVCCARLQVRHKPVLLECGAVSSPALHGCFHPRLLLPKGFLTTFSPAELGFVFLHELAHLKRRDLLMNWMATGLQIIHWFNPLVWWGFARWRADRELACDAMALAAADPDQNKQYGRTILRLLESFEQPVTTPGLVGILEDKHQLRRRIAMIAGYVPNQGWPRLGLALAGVLAVVGLTDAKSGAPPAPNIPTGTPAAMAESVSAAATGAAVPPVPTNSNNEKNEQGQAMKNVGITNAIVRAATIGALALATPTTMTVAQADDNPTAPTAPALDGKMNGAWVLVGSPGHIHKAPSAGGRIAFITGAHWCITQADAKSGIVLFHHGGTYTRNGNQYHQDVEFANPSTMEYIGKTNGNFNVTVEGDTLTDIGVDNPWKEVWRRLKPAEAKPSPIDRLNGMWVYVGKPGETNLTLDPHEINHRIKFCVDGYWCDTGTDEKTGVVIIHHGGTCSLNGDQYVETCQYANPITMNLIGRDVKFSMQLEGDRLTLKGIGNPWQEVWQRLD